jgi:hypothetical protein
MMAFTKLLVLVAIYLPASLRNAFIILSLASEGKQVWVNHLIEFQEPMRIPTNESCWEPLCKPTKRIHFDAELPNNLSEMKTQVAYSEPKQDAELPSKITDLTDTQPCGLCRDKKSEQVMFCDQLQDEEIPSKLQDSSTTQPSK